MISPKQLLLIMLVMGLMGACGDSVVQRPNITIEGEVGDTVILPCSTEDIKNISDDPVDWYKGPRTSENKPVHKYIQLEDVLLGQRDDFRHRTSLFKEELSSGNCSLSLKVNTSDSGTYYCYVAGRLYSNVTLKVLSKGENNPEVTPSPDNPNNGTDGQTNYLAIAGGGGGGGIAALLLLVGIIILAVHFCSNTPQTNQRCSYQTAPPPQDQETERQNPNQEEIPLEIV